MPLPGTAGGAKARASADRRRRRLRLGAADLPWEHYYLFQAPNPAEDDWARGRELAARAYFERTAALV